jgi:hypothetical protein
VEAWELFLLALSKEDFLKNQARDIGYPDHGVVPAVAPMDVLKCAESSAASACSVEECGHVRAIEVGLSPLAATAGGDS